MEHTEMLKVFFGDKPYFEGKGKTPQVKIWNKDKSEWTNDVNDVIEHADAPYFMWTGRVDFFNYPIYFGDIISMPYIGDSGLQDRVFIVLRHTHKTAEKSSIKLLYGSIIVGGECVFSNWMAENASIISNYIEMPNFNVPHEFRKLIPNNIVKRGRFL